MLANIYKEAKEVIEEAYEIWYSINDTVGDAITNYGLNHEVRCNIPTVWDLRDLILEICVDNSIRSVWYLGNPLLIHEFLDCLDSVLDMEKIEYLGGDFYIMNNSQEILIDELL